MSGRESAVALGHMFGTGLMLILPIAIGYWWGKRLSAKREGYEPVRWPVAVGFAVSLLVLLAQCTRHADASTSIVVTSHG